jgi:hypothetical protein
MPEGYTVEMNLLVLKAKLDPQNFLFVLYSLKSQALWGGEYGAWDKFQHGRRIRRAGFSFRPAGGTVCQDYGGPVFIITRSSILAI